jgi:hypothetical protein
LLRLSASSSISRLDVGVPEVGEVAVEAIRAIDNADPVAEDESRAFFLRNGEVKTMPAIGILPTSLYRYT